MAPSEVKKDRQSYRDIRGVNKDPRWEVMSSHSFLHTNTRTAPAPSHSRTLSRSPSCLHSLPGPLSLTKETPPRRISENKRFMELERQSV